MAEHRGWSFPVGLDERGRIQLVNGREAVEGRIRSILWTVAGERVMRPDLGIQLDWTTDELPDRIAELLGAAESQAVIRHVEVGTPDPALGSFLEPVLGVTVHYELRRNGERHRFTGAIPWIR